MMTYPDAVACAVFLLTAFVLAGLVQVAWLRSPHSRALAAPIDAGLTFRGRRLFGDHKTLRGIVVMVPAAAGAFVALAFLAGERRFDWLWPLPLAQYAALGAGAGFGFMAGELPNSFVKRQLGIAPGSAAASRPAAALQFVADRLDSALGMLIAVSVAVPMPALTWMLVLLAGPPLHWVFSILLFQLGVKARPA